MRLQRKQQYYLLNEAFVLATERPNDPLWILKKRAEEEQTAVTEERQMSQFELE